MLLLRFQHLLTHVLDQRRGQLNRAILPLTVLDDRGPHSRSSQAGTIKVVGRSRLACSDPVSDVAAPWLEVGEVPDGGDLKPAIDARRIDLQVEDSRG